MEGTLYERSHPIQIEGSEPVESETDRLWLSLFPEVELLIGSACLQHRVAELAHQIGRDYQGLEPLLISVLKGSIIFLSDLLRGLPLPVMCDFVAISSYGVETQTSGVVRLLKDLDTHIQNRHVLVVEDIVDSGLTLNYLLELLATRKPASLKVCTLLHKPARQQIAVPLHYCGFAIPNVFVVGYGLDCAEKYRNLPFIGVLHESPWRRYRCEVWHL